MKRLIPFILILGLILFLGGCSVMDISNSNGGGVPSTNVVANLDWGNDNHRTGDSVLLDGRDSYCKEAGAKVSCELEYNWQIDGETVTRDKSGPVYLKKGLLSYTFKETGTHKVVLTVLNKENEIDTIAREIEINNSAPNACLDIVELDDRKRKLVIEDSFDVDGEIVKIEIDFGDGDSKIQNSLEPITHMYPKFSGRECPDTYKAEITVTDNEGAKDSITRRVVICYTC